MFLVVSCVSVRDGRREGATGEVENVPSLLDRDSTSLVDINGVVCFSLYTHPPSLLPYIFSLAQYTNETMVIYIIYLKLLS